MDKNQNLKFNTFQEFFFPIYKFELKKFIPMSLLMFSFVFIYHLAKLLKDFFVHYNTNLWVGARPEETANLVSALKLWYVFPSAFLMVIIFTAVLDRFGPKKSFYIVISAFMTFYFLYGFVLYPNLSKIVLSPEQITAITSKLPVFFRAFVTCLANWPITLFYVVSELWGTTAISFLFWQFANRVTMNHEVKRFFGLFSLLANFGTILAGNSFVTYAKNMNVQSVKILITLIIAVGIFVLGIYAYINNVVLKDPLLYDESKILHKKSKKEKVGATEGIKILFKNSYLMLIVVLILAYGICINFSEIMMVSCMKEVLSREQFVSIQGSILIWTGIISSIIAIFSNNILRRFSWKIGAIITPCSFLIVGGLFQAVLLYKQFISPTLFGMPAAMVAIFCGVLCDSFSRGFKYSVFDATKSMAYLPLNDDEKNKGQAAVEIIGGRAGKATASIIQQVMISFPKTLKTTTGVVSGLLAYTPVMVVSFLTTVTIWIISVMKLGDKYESKLKEKSSILG